MNKRKIITAIAVLSLISFSGCNKGEEPEVVKTRNNISTEMIKTNATQIEPIEIESPKERVSITSFKKDFPYFDKETGFVSHTQKEIEDELLSDGNYEISVLPDSKAKIKFYENTDSKTLYKFTLSNCLPYDLNGSYLVNLKQSSGETFYLLLGQERNGVSFELAKQYVKPQNEITYYCIANYSNGKVVLRPLMCQYRYSDVYVVKPTLKSMGVDVSEMKDPTLISAVTDKKIIRKGFTG